MRASSKRLGKHVGWAKLELTWKVCAASWLSCREVRALTGASIQTVSNLRREARRLRLLYPRLRLWKLSLRDARALLRTD